MNVLQILLHGESLTDPLRKTIFYAQALLKREAIDVLLRSAQLCVMVKGLRLVLG